jgi:predicted phage gp36 major capsid-like protein
MTENKKDDICKSDVGTAFSALPTKSTLDAVEHATDLMNQRKKRAESAVEIPNEANTERKAGTDDGDKEEYSVDDEYPIQEAEDQLDDESGESNSGTEPSPLNQ